jgi:hypothetical protein
MSVETAEAVSTWANWALVAALVAGVLATYAIVVSGNVKEANLKQRIAEAGERASKANQRAAASEAEAARLRLQLEHELQKRAPRALTEEQKATLLEELRGKISEINIVVQRDLESQAFALQLEIVLQEAGAVLHPYELPPGEALAAPAGIVMYRPGGARSEEEMAADPLYRALKKANLFGGFAGIPFLSSEKLSLGPMLSADQYVLYVGQKLPW